MEYKTIHKEESYGASSFGIKISIASNKMPDLKQDRISNAAYKAVDIVKAEVCAAIKANDPKTPEQIKENHKIVDLFSSPIFIEEIPNGYCGDWCCRHLPWFVVTTTIGRIKIGWRKRVINIDWSDTICKEYSADLFKDEDTTKYDHYIHAWSLGKAKEYIEAIIKSGLN